MRNALGRAAAVVVAAGLGLAVLTSGPGAAHSTGDIVLTLSLGLGGLVVITATSWLMEHGWLR